MFQLMFYILIMVYQLFILISNTKLLKCVCMYISDLFTAMTSQLFQSPPQIYLVVCIDQNIQSNVLQYKVYVFNISLKIKYDAVNVFQNIMLQTTLRRKVKVKALIQQEVKGQIKVIAVEGQGQGDRGLEWGSHDHRFPLWLPWIQPLICELICMHGIQICSN